MEENVQNSQIQIVPPHQYPLIIRASVIAIALLSTCTIIFFMLYEVPEHRSVSNRIKAADTLFQTKAYFEAIMLYQDISDDYPAYTQAKIKIAKSCFALSEENQDLYEYGLFLLADEKFNNKEYAQLVSYVPTKYHEDFHSNFKDIKV